MSPFLSPRGRLLGLIRASTQEEHLGRDPSSSVMSGKGISDIRKGLQPRLKSAEGAVGTALTTLA